MKIAVVVSDAPELASTLIVLRRSVPDTSLSDLRQRIASGTPVVEFTLFENDHEVASGMLRALVQEFPANNARLRIFELRPSESFADVDLSTREISPEVLLNILNEAERVLAENELGR